MTDDPKHSTAKLRDLARKLEAEESEEAIEATVKKILLAPKPEPEKPI